MAEGTGGVWGCVFVHWVSWVWDQLYPFGHMPMDWSESMTRRFLDVTLKQESVEAEGR